MIKKFLLFTILKGYPDDTFGKPGDPRKDSRIYRALKKAKILVE